MLSLIFILQLVTSLTPEFRILRRTTWLTPRFVVCADFKKSCCQSINLQISWTAWNQAQNYVYFFNLALERPESEICQQREWRVLNFQRIQKCVPSSPRFTNPTHLEIQPMLLWVLKSVEIRVNWDWGTSLVNWCISHIKARSCSCIPRVSAAVHNTVDMGFSSTK